MRYALLSALLLSGCVDAIAASAPPPIVSDYNGHVVKLMYHPYPLGEGYKASPVYAKAVEVCGGDAVYQGTRQVGPYDGEHIFLCKR